MNTATIYREATTPKAKKEEEKAKEAKALEDALFAEGLEKQGFDKWLQMKETQSFLKGLAFAYEAALLVAKHNSVTDGETTKWLIQAHILEKVTHYARNKTPIY